MKVGREEIAGLVTALRRYVAGDDAAERARWESMLGEIAAPLRDVAGVTVRCEGRAVPLLSIDLEPESVGFTAYEALNRLMDGDPAVALAESRAEFDTLIVNPVALGGDGVAVVRDRLAALLGSSVTR